MNKWIMAACAAALVAVVCMRMNSVKADAVEQAPAMEMQEEMVELQPDAVEVTEEVVAEPAVAAAE
jgi:hypothetical protein